MRFAEKGDFPAVRALWETCFPDEGGFNDYFFAHFYKEKYTLLYLEGETLVAMAQMLPYHMTVGGLSREVTYIYGACTDPAHRRKGYMARLLERSFELDREAGRIASVLILPYFSPGDYLHGRGARSTSAADLGGCACTGGAV